MDWMVGNKRWIDITCNAGKGCLCGALPPTGITAGGWGEAVDKGIILPQVTRAGLRCDPTILRRRIQHLHLSRQLCGFNEKGIACLSFVLVWRNETNQPCEKKCLYSSLIRTFPQSGGARASLVKLTVHFCILLKTPSLSQRFKPILFVSRRPRIAAAVSSEGKRGDVYLKVHREGGACSKKKKKGKENQLAIRYTSENVRLMWENVFAVLLFK